MNMSKWVWQSGKISRGVLAIMSLAVLFGATAFAWVVRDAREPIQRMAEEYVVLALGLSAHREQEIDAYFGPQSLQQKARRDRLGISELLSRAGTLLAALEQESLPERERQLALIAKVVHLMKVLDYLEEPTEVSFRDEALSLFGVSLPVAIDTDGAAMTLQQLNQTLTGQGSLSFKLAAFRNQTVVPADRRIEVFERALEECRQRTLAHWPLPGDRGMTIEWSREVGAAWYRYHGNGQGTLTINPLSLALVGSMLDVACHEGYPGHHAQFLLMEQAAGDEGLPVEDTVVLLRSPVTALREAAANLGAGLVFSDAERLAFERDVLFPMAGLSPAQAETNALVHGMMEQLSIVTVPILEAYRDGELSFNNATVRLDREALIGSPSDLLLYVNDFGAYAASYTVARDQLRNRLSARSRSESRGVMDLLGEMLMHPGQISL